MVNVEDEVDECVGVVHPAQVQDHRSVEVTKPVLGERLDDGGDEDSKRSHQDGRRLIFDCLELDRIDFPVYEGIECGHETKNVLGVYGHTNADARNVRVCWYQACWAHVERRQCGDSRRERERTCVASTGVSSEGAATNVMRFTRGVTCSIAASSLSLVTARCQLAPTIVIRRSAVRPQRQKAMKSLVHARGHDHCIRTRGNRAQQDRRYRTEKSSLEYDALLPRLRQPTRSVAVPEI
jgi:hypothetical protein